MNFQLNDLENWFESLVQKGIYDKCYAIDVHNLNLEQEIKSAYQKGIMCVMFSPEIHEAGSSFDDTFDTYSMVCFFVQKINFKQNNSIADRKEIRNATLEAAKAVRKEIKDIVKNYDIPCHFFKYTVQNSFHFQKVGPLWDNLYGWSMEFSFQIPEEN